MKKTVIFVMLLAVVIGGFYLAQRAPEPAETIEGTVTYSAASARTMIIRSDDDSETTLALVNETRIFDVNGEPIPFTAVEYGSEVLATGKRTGTGTFIPDTVRVTVKDPARLAAPCPGIVAEEHAGFECRMPVGSKVAVSLPQGSYDMSKLSVDGDMLKEAFGGDSPEGRSMRAFEAVRAGEAEIDVPSAAGGEDFKITIFVHGPEYDAEMI